MKHILLTVAYDGTFYHGWQRQKNQITVQEAIESCLTRMFNQKISIRGASRTDAGVHAKGQRALFSVDTTIPVEKLPLAINNTLPGAIRIIKAREVCSSFHPQFSALSKSYCYSIYNRSIIDPVYNNYAWHVKSNLKIDLMKKAAESLIGEKDFKAFQAVGSGTKTTVRTIYRVNIENRDNIINIHIVGNGFLYNMVRIISGTLAYVGYGKLQPDDMEKIILSKNRAEAGITAPPQGLSLLEINYADESP